MELLNKYFFCVWIMSRAGGNMVVHIFEWIHMCISFRHKPDHRVGVSQSMYMFSCGCSVTKLCLALHDPVDYSTPGFPVLHYLPKFVQTHVYWVWANIEFGLILFCPLFLLPSIFSSIRGFSNESALHIRWPKYCSFSFSISPSSEYSELISCGIDWFDLLAVQGTVW